MTHNQILSEKMKLANISEVELRNRVEVLEQENRLLKARNS